jgi:virulence-associated protein VagC
VVLQVDQSERTRSVRLPNGLFAGMKRVAIAAGA